MDDDLNKYEKNHLELNKGERIIYSNESQKQFNVPQNIDEFNESFAKGNYFEVDPCLPKFRERQGYLNRLYTAKKLLEEKRDDEIYLATQKVKYEYTSKLEVLEHGIKKLEAIIFLKEKCNNFVILEDGKVK